MSTEQKVDGRSVDQDELFALNPLVIKHLLPEQHHAAFEKDFYRLSEWCRLAKEEHEESVLRARNLFFDAYA